jgi:hypothetical protein
MKKYQVFISSTYEELKEERKIIIENLLKLNCIPIGMEMISASDTIVDVTKHTIDMCDYLILVLGNKYGSLNSDGISFIEFEYDYAISNNIPVLIFIKNEIDKIETDSNFVRFREKLLNSHFVNFWRTKHELSYSILVSLKNAFIEIPRMGWTKQALLVEDSDVFLSYSWNDGTLANELDSKFNQKGFILKRDIRDIQYRQSIKTFMKQIRENDYVLIIISKSYLKSSNCMFEVLELVKDENYKSRILPIIKSDAEIFNIIGRSKYIEYWQNEYNNIREYMENIDELSRSKLVDELKRIELIKRTLPDFLEVITDMKVVVCEGEYISQSDFNNIFHSIFETNFNK